MITAQNILTLMFLVFPAMGFSQINKDKSYYEDAIFEDNYLSHFIEESIATAHTSKDEKVLFENGQVRVCEVILKPSESKNIHPKDWSSILYIQGDGDFIDTCGKIVFDTRNLPKPLTYPANIYKEPDALHQITNVNKTKTLRLIRVEMKN